MNGKKYEKRIYTYFANGIAIESHIQFPELNEQKIDQPEVTIEFGEVPSSIPNPVYQGPTSQAGDGKYLLYVRDVATYYLEKQNKRFSIKVSPLDGVDLNEIRIFILSSMLGAVCHMKGLLPLHASGVVINGKAVLFCGKSGLGKSTLCAALYQEGFPFITDNLAAIYLNTNGTPMVHPSYTHFKLYEDSIDKLNMPHGNTRKIRPGMDKKSLLLNENVQESPVPLHRIYHLNQRNNKNIKIECLEGSQKAEVIVNETFRIKLLKSIGQPKTYFNTLNCICTSIEVAKIYRSSESFEIKELVKLILKDLEES